MFCYKCGKQLVDGSRFCDTCGAAQPPSQPVAPVAAQPPAPIVPLTPVAPAPIKPPYQQTAPSVAEPVFEQPAAPVEPIAPSTPFATPYIPPVPTTPAPEQYVPNSASVPKKKSKKLWIIPVVAVALAVVIALIAVLLPNGSKFTDNSSLVASTDGTAPEEQIYDPSYDPTTATEVVDFTRTVLIYIVGSDLESKGGAATLDIQEMIDAEFDSSKTQVILCLGGSKSWKNNVVSASETSYYRVSDNDLSKVQQNSAQNMANSSTLSDFINWGVSNYPADRYSLFLWDHGGGPINGYGHDELANDMMSLPDIITAISDSPFNKSNKLELFGFDACLMGSAEVAWAFKDYAHYYIASQETEPGHGWDYEFLTKVPYCKNGGDMGKVIVDSYFAYYDVLFKQNPRYESELTLSCVDLSKIGEVEQGINTLFSNVNVDVAAGKIATASRCRQNSKAFGKSGTTSSYDLIDLSHIASLLSSNYSGASDLQTAINNAVIYSKANVKNAYGISIFHPYDKVYNSTLINAVYNTLSFASNYRDYIINFTNGIQAGAQSQSSYRGFSRTMGTSTASGQNGCDFSIKLTEEQMQTFARAEYYVFWEMPSSVTFSKKTEYLQVFSGQDVNVSSDGTLSASYDGKAVFGKNNATGKYSDCPLSMNQIYDGTLEEKYYFPCMFWFFGEDSFDMNVENVNWLMKIKDGKPQLLNAYYMESVGDGKFPDKLLLDPDDFTIYGFMNNAYFVNTDANNNTVFTFSGSTYGFEYTKEDGFSLELRPITNKSEYRAVFVIEDIYGNRYFSDFIPLA